MKLYVKHDDQWLYPDEQALGTAPYSGQLLQLHAAVGGSCGIQILADELSQGVTVEAKNARVYVLREVTVQYNTADDETSGFADAPFVYFQQQAACPPHCTRIAPFQVYDAYIPFDGQKPETGRQAFYVQLDTACPGQQDLTLTLTSGEETETVRLQLHCYDAGLPETPTFSMDNWFSWESMARRHGTEPFTPAHFDKMRQYAQIMASMRQTHFLITPELLLREGKLDFALLEQVAGIFFEAGLQTMKIGPLGQRMRVYHADLRALEKDGDTVDSPEGQALLRQFFEGLSAMAEKNGWQEKIAFHLADEPDEPESAIPVRMRQYAMLREMVRKYFPAARVCEAVKTAAFQEYIDILVPLSKTYEQDPVSFENARKQGREIWLYICCVPTGNYYHRFLDVPLSSCRHLFWSIARNHISGYLHWGLNQLEENQHPFLQTNQSHTYGDGKLLPAGDSHILYPDGEKIYCSMRMNMCRKGCEDVELLKRLEACEPELWQELTEDHALFHGTADPQSLRQRSIRLLKALDKKETALCTEAL